VGDTCGWVSAGASASGRTGNEGTRELQGRDRVWLWADGALSVRVVVNVLLSRVRIELCGWHRMPEFVTQAGLFLFSSFLQLIHAIGFTGA